MKKIVIFAALISCLMLTSCSPEDQETIQTECSTVTGKTSTVGIGNELSTFYLYLDNVKTKVRRSDFDDYNIGDQCCENVAIN